jgi:DNA polymerase-3 subunit epsilon
LLKRRGYRWSDGSDGRPRSWYIDVDESKLDDEIVFLKTEILRPGCGAALADPDGI